MTKNAIYKSESGKSTILNFYENLLNDWHKPFENHIIKTELGDTFVIESGQKSNLTIVLLHGSSSNSAMWIADAQIFSENYRVIAIDIIGECGKSANNRPAFKNHIYADWLNHVFEKLNINNATIIACSLGGWIALDFSIHYPKKIDKLVLLATAGIAPIKLSTVFWIIITSVLGDWGFKKLNKMVYNNLEIDKIALDFTVLIKNYYKPRTDVLPIFSDEQLQNIQAQTLFIGGENDCFFNSEQTASRLAKNVKSVRSHILSNTGHVVVNQLKTIIDFMNSAY